MVHTGDAKIEDKRDYIRTCRMCGRELPAGGTRRLGVCVWCVAERESEPRIVKRQSYDRQSDSN